MVQSGANKHHPATSSSHSLLPASLLGEVPELDPEEDAHAFRILKSEIVCPGDIITHETGFIAGKGVMEGPDGKCRAVVLGRVYHIHGRNYDVGGRNYDAVFLKIYIIVMQSTNIQYQLRQYSSKIFYLFLTPIATGESREQVSVRGARARIAGIRCR